MIRPLGAIHYEDADGDATTSSLEITFIQHEEGRYRPNGNEMIYEYNLTDHLGNTRITFGDADADGLPEILQENHYYPFGMAMTMSSTLAAAPPNNYLYNGKELQDELGLDWYDYGARMYDASIGRWNGVDPLAELYLSSSPYAYVMNNPLNLIDPTGMSAEGVESEKTPGTDDLSPREKRRKMRQEKRKHRAGKNKKGSSSGDPIYGHHNSRIKDFPGYVDQKEGIDWPEIGKEIQTSYPNGTTAAEVARQWGVNEKTVVEMNTDGGKLKLMETYAVGWNWWLVPSLDYLDEFEKVKIGYIPEVQVKRKEFEDWFFETKVSIIDYTDPAYPQGIVFTAYLNQTLYGAWMIGMLEHDSPSAKGIDLESSVEKYRTFTILNWAPSVLPFADIRDWDEADLNLKASIFYNAAQRKGLDGFMLRANPYYYSTD